MSTTHSNPLQRPLRIILLALCVAIAGIGGYGVMQNLRVEELEQILAALETEKSKAVAEAGSLRGGAAAQEAQVKEMEAELTSLRAQVAESNLARAALDTPQALAALEAAAKSAKSAKAEHHLALGGLRLLTKGKQDAPAAAAFERALVLDKSSCAAHAALAAMGKKTELPPACAPVVAATPAAAAAPTAAPAAAPTATPVPAAPADAARGEGKGEGKGDGKGEGKGENKKADSKS